MHRLSIASPICGLLLLLPCYASAQDPSPTPPVVIEQVEVVATRLPQSPHDVPAAIEVISGDVLRGTNALTLPQALRLAAGVDIAPGGDNGPASSVPEFRGLREFDAFLLVVDDIPWGGAFNPALATLSLQDVERIEILRGPAPVTYGATSFVGVIHVVHKPGTEHQRYASVHGGSHGSGGASIDLPIAALGSWQSRLTVDGGREGFADSATSFRRGHALWRVAHGDTNRRQWFTVDVNWLAQNPASPHPRSGTSLTPLVPIDANHNPAHARLDDTRLSLAYGFDRSLGGEQRWAATISLSHSSQDILRGFLSRVSNTVDNARGLREKIDTTDVYADTHVTWPTHREVQLVAGGDVLYGRGDAKGATFDYTTPLSGVVAPEVGEGEVLTLGIEDRRAFFGAYGLVEWRPWQRVSLSGGLRLNVTSEERGGNEAEPAAADLEARQTHVKPTGTIGSLATLWERGANHLRAYGSYRWTFKPAAFDFGLGDGGGEEGEEGLLDPETAKSYEAGVKMRTLQGRVDVELDVFRIDFQNLVTATVVSGLPALTNTGRTRFDGAEIASDLRLPRHLTGRATYSFHRARFVDFVQTFDGVPTQLAGKQLEMSPTHMGGAALIYAPEHGAVAHLMLKGIGSRYLTKRNTAIAGTYAVVDAGIGYRVGHWELRVDGRNLGDRRDPVAESELGDGQYYRLPGRHLDARLVARF